MPTGTYEYRSDAERRAIEAAIAFTAETFTLAQSSPSLSTLSSCEAHVFSAGRELLRICLRDSFQARIDSDEQKKTAPPVPALVATPSA